MVIYGNSADMTAMFSSGAYINQRAVDRVRDLADTLKGFSSGVVDRLRQWGDTEYHAENMSRAKRALRNVGVYRDDGLKPIRDASELYDLGTLARRYLMSEPTYRKRFLGGTVYGYDVPKSALNSGIGETDSVYQELTNGLIMENQDGDLGYINYYVPQDMSTLALHEQLDVQKIWALARAALDQGDDPTDVLR